MIPVAVMGLIRAPLDLIARYASQIGILTKKITQYSTPFPFIAAALRSGLASSRAEAGAMFRAARFFKDQRVLFAAWPSDLTLDPRVAGVAFRPQGDPELLTPHRYVVDIVTPTPGTGEVRRWHMYVWSGRPLDPTDIIAEGVAALVARFQGKYQEPVSQETQREWKAIAEITQYTELKQRP